MHNLWQRNYDFQKCFIKNCKCNDCKNNYKQCAICGRLKVNGICENEFVNNIIHNILKIL